MLDTAVQFYWSAFWELASDRQIGFGGEGRIPSVAIDLFAQRYGVEPGDEYASFLAIIRAMDSEYLGIRTRKPGGEIFDETSITDLSGLRGLLSRLGKKPAEASAISSASAAGGDALGPDEAAAGPAV